MNAPMAEPGRSSDRPWRPVVTAASLADLRGPASGVVELPHRMFWQPDRHVDLDVPALLVWAYETVLRESLTARELEQWLDGPTLVRVWRDLYLPAYVRRAWEQRHPEELGRPAG